MEETHWGVSDAFGPVALETWKALVAKDLKGRPVEKLARVVEGGLSIRALYTAEDVQAGSVEGDHRRGALGRAPGWEVRQRYEVGEAAEVGRQIGEELGRGVEGVELVFEAGVPCPALAELDVILGGVDLERVPVSVMAGARSAEVARALLEVAGERGVDAGALRLEAGLDPVRDAVATGFADAGAWDVAAELARRFGAEGCGRALAVDTTVWHDAGIDDVRAVAVALATGVEALRELTARGVSGEAVAAQIVFRVALGTAFFFEIARLRALRVTWSRVLEACGLEASSMRVVVHPGRRALTERDANVNMLRNVAVVFAGAVGGADAITTVAFDGVAGAPSALGRRVARNTQLVLAQESHLGDVIDPAGGSWFIEVLTDQIAARAWELFQGIEREGGVGAAVRAGTIQAAVRRDEAARQEEIRRRRRSITGVSEFPALDEVIVAAAVRGSAALEGVGERVERLEARPLAAGFEALRARSDGWLAVRGSRPTVMMVSLGTLAQSIGRSTWSRSFLEAGGLAAREHEGELSPAALGESLGATGVGMAVICGGDESYASEGVAVVAALREAGARTIILAGRPGELEGALREAGLTDAIYLGCDVLGTLESLWSRLEPV